MSGASRPAPPAAPWSDYLRPLRVDHWIKNLVVPVGSALALVAHRAPPTRADAVAMVAAFCVSGLVSSVNYAINEILDAPFDARHPVKRLRPIPSGRVRVGPLLGLTAVIGLAAAVAAGWGFSPPFRLACLLLFGAGLVYNLPPLRLKDWPYLDAPVESLTNPIRLAIGWTAVSVPGLSPPPLFLLGAVWGFGAFLMTGKRLAELRLLGAQAASYRPTFRHYSVGGLLAAQLAYAVIGLGILGGGVAADRPRILWGLPLLALLLGWALRMTFEPDSPLIDPEHLYRRPGFLLLACLAFAILVALAVT